MLEQLDQAVLELYRALHPRSMVTGTPVKAAAVGSGEKGDDPRDLVGLDQALDRVRGEDDVLEDLRFADAVRLRLVGELPLDQRRAHVARADRGGA